VKAIVVYESIYGNTRAIAEAIADGLGGAEVKSVPDAAADRKSAELLVVGGPTHMHGLATTRSRQAAIDGAQEDGHTHIEPSAGKGPGLRAWLRDLEHVDHLRAAAFDTRLDRAPWVTGVAARGIGRRLHRHGYDVIGNESFLVEESEGPLEDGELERARAWGEELARLCSDDR
jgi:Flavodoxin